MTRIRNSIALVAFTALGLLSVLPAVTLSGPRSADPHELPATSVPETCSPKPTELLGLGDLEPHPYVFLEESVSSRELAQTSTRRAHQRLAPHALHDAGISTRTSPRTARARVAGTATLAIASLLAHAKLGRLAAPSTAPPEPDHI